MNAFLALSGLLCSSDACAPEGRRLATAGTLRQMAHLAGPEGDTLSLGDLLSAYEVLGTPREGDEGPVVNRRSTLRELAALSTERGDASRVAPALRSIAREALSLSTGDPRMTAVASTATREASELNG